MWHFVEKSLLQGGIVSLGTVYCLGTGGIVTFPFTDLTMPLWSFAFAIGSATTVANDLIHVFLQETIPINKKITHNASIIVGSLLAAGFYVGGMYMVNPALIEQIGMLKLLLIGAGGEIGSGIILDLLKD